MGRIAGGFDQNGRVPRALLSPQNRHGVRGLQARPIRLTCPPTAKAFSGIAIVPGPPISTTQSIPRPSVSSRTFASQSGVSMFPLVPLQLRRWVGLSTASDAVYREPAIDDQLGASDVFGLVGREEQRRVSD